MDENLIAAFQNPPANFYVYVLARPCGTPFYVGMGKVRQRHQLQRIFHHEIDANKGRNSRKSSVIRKILRNGQSIQKTIESWHDRKEDAFAREVYLIDSLGRVGTGTGPLVNCNAGGTGQVDPAPEVREKMRKAQRANADKAKANAPLLASVLPKAIEAAQSWRRENPDEVKGIIHKAVSASLLSRFGSEASLKEWSEKLSVGQKRRIANSPDHIARVSKLGRQAAEEWKKRNPAECREMAALANEQSRIWAAQNPEKKREIILKATKAAVAKRAIKTETRARCAGLVAKLGQRIEEPSWRAPLSVWQNFEKELSLRLSRPDGD